MEDGNSSLAAQIRREYQYLSSPDPECCIFRVRNTLLASHGSNYIPSIVTIGPLHRQWESLQTRQHKASYSHSFITRYPSLELHEYVQAMEGLEAKTRRSYREEIDLNSREFVTMMLVDGCFILELFLKFYHMDGIFTFPDDPFLSNLATLNSIRKDLMLLENQLPLFVLQCLFNLSTAFNNTTVSLIDLALHFFGQILPGHGMLIRNEAVDARHLLDLLRRGYAPQSSNQLQYHGDAPKVLKLSARQLQDKAWVRLKKGKSRGLLDVNFHFSGVLEIPALKIQEETECLFRNFIAFEQCCGGRGTYISDYICFMGSLINSWYDENELCLLGVLDRSLPNYRVFQMLEVLSAEMIIHNSHFSGLCEKVERHCASSWRLTVANLFLCFEDPCFAFASLAVLAPFLLIISGIFR